MLVLNLSPHCRTGDFEFFEQRPPEPGRLPQRKNPFEVNEMFCPRCGNNSDSDQKYCRGCGFELQRVSELLQETTAIESTADSENVRSLLDQRKLVLVGSVVVLSTIGVALLGVVVALIVSILNGTIPALFGGFALFLLLGISLGFVALGLASVRQQQAKQSSKADKALLKDEPLPALEQGNAQSVYSVTERTTELLTAGLKEKDS